MSMLSKNLEKSLHRAFGLAGERRHEYATLEHLLLAMTEDDDAVPVREGAATLAVLPCGSYDQCAHTLRRRAIEREDLIEAVRVP